MKSYKNVAAGLAVATALMPLVSFAQSTTDVNSQIQSLLSQIRTLQQQLTQLIASSTMARLNASSTAQLAPGQLSKQTCIELRRDLRIGERGEDVKKLQELLKEDMESGFSGQATGYFGPMTARAMMKFQQRFDIAKNSDGSVGPLTRGFFERACGKGLGKKSDDSNTNAAQIGGTISAVASSSITVSAGNGTSRIVNITASTSIKVFANATSTPTSGTMADLIVGKSVRAEGSKNADGSLTAREIKVGPVPAAIGVMPMMGEWNARKFIEDIEEMMKPMKANKGKSDDRDDD